MSVGKLQRFQDLKKFSNVIEPIIEYPANENSELKSKWKKEIFKNENPIVLELGCGKGEYSLELARKNSNKNFLGIDIKGARIWIGAREALKENLTNMFFLRVSIDFIERFFGKNEIDEIWIPHPDPQPKKPRKRLTSPHFLNIYQNFLKHNSIVHLKTDNTNLYQYTLDVLNHNKIEILEHYDDIHSANLNNEVTNVQTYFERMFMEQGSKIKYIKFRLRNDVKIQEPISRYIPNYKY